jgi:hypothetical protein
MPRKPATLAMPTRVPRRAARIAAMNGWNAFTMPMTLVSRTARNAGRSSAWSVSVPRETPALATTMSGVPKRAVKSAAAAASAGASRTSPA